MSKTTELQSAFDGCWSARQTARYFGVTEMTISLWRRKYGVPAVLINGRFFFVPEDVRLWRRERLKDRTLFERRKRRRVSIRVHPQPHATRQTDVAKHTTAAKPKTKTTHAKERRPSIASLRKTARRMVIKNPAISIEELQTALNKEGFNTTKLMVASHRNSVRDMIRLMQAEGLLKDVAL